MILPLLLPACVEPPLLSRVADALAADVSTEATPAVALFVSAAALVAEPCAAETLDDYTYEGHGARAFRVTRPVVTIDEASSTRQFSFGEVDIAGDTGTLKLESDLARRNWTAVFSGNLGVFNASFVSSLCESDGSEVALRSGVSGSGVYVAGGVEHALLITGGTDAVLEWSPSTAALPIDGEITWRIAEEQNEIELADAVEIDPDTRAWPGVAAGTNWSSDTAVVLP